MAPSCFFTLLLVKMPVFRHLFREAICDIFCVILILNFVLIPNWSQHKPSVNSLERRNLLKHVEVKRELSKNHIGKIEAEIINFL